MCSHFAPGDLAYLFFVRESKTASIDLSKELLSIPRGVVCRLGVFLIELGLFKLGMQGIKEANGATVFKDNSTRIEGFENGGEEGEPFPGNQVAGSMENILP